MKTFTLSNKHFIYYPHLNASEDFDVIMQLYYIAKAEACVKQLPLLPLNDFRQRTAVPSIKMKKNKVSLLQLITGHLHALTSPLFKKPAA